MTTVSIPTTTVAVADSGVDVALTIGAATTTVTATGGAGPANSLAIGSVTAGTAAAATITGTAPSQTLSLTLPSAAWGNITGTLADQTDLDSALAGKEARSFGVKNDPTAGFYCLPGAAFVGQTTIPLSNAGRPYFVAFNNPRTWQITDVQVIVNVASGTAGTLARIGLYQASAWASAPDVLTLVTDFGTVDVSALGAKTIALGTPYTMTPGVYWVCVVQAVDATSGASLAGINAATPDAFMAMVLISNGWRSYSSLEVAANWTANVSSGLPSSATGAQNAVASNTTNQNPHAVLFRGSPA